MFDSWVNPPLESSDPLVWAFVYSLLWAPWLPSLKTFLLWKLVFELIVWVIYPLYRGKWSFGLRVAIFGAGLFGWLLGRLVFKR